MGIEGHPDWYVGVGAGFKGGCCAGCPCLNNVNDVFIMDADGKGGGIWCELCAKQKPLARPFELQAWNKHVACETHKAAARLHASLETAPDVVPEPTHKAGSEEEGGVTGEAWAHTRASLGSAKLNQ